MNTKDLRIYKVFSHWNPCAKRTQTHIENDLLVRRRMLPGSVTTVADERPKNRIKEIMITLMDALTFILAVVRFPCLSFYIYYYVF